MLLFRFVENDCRMNEDDCRMKLFDHTEQCRRSDTARSLGAFAASVPIHDLSDSGPEDGATRKLVHPGNFLAKAVIESRLDAVCWVHDIPGGRGWDTVLSNIPAIHPPFANASNNRDRNINLSSRKSTCADGRDRNKASAYRLIGIASRRFCKIAPP
jgi:hypothetical protein